MFINISDHNVFILSKTRDKIALFFIYSDISVKSKFVSAAVQNCKESIRNICVGQLYNLMCGIPLVRVRMRSFRVTRVVTGSES